MINPTTGWHRTEVPPLRADIGRRRRDYRRRLAQIERTGWVTVAALLGFAAGALYPLIDAGALT